MQYICQGCKQIRMQREAAILQTTLFICLAPMVHWQSAQNTCLKKVESCKAFQKPKTLDISRPKLNIWNPLFNKLIIYSRARFSGIAWCMQGPRKVNQWFPRVSLFEAIWWERFVPLSQNQSKLMSSPLPMKRSRIIPVPVYLSLSIMIT